MEELLSKEAGLEQGQLMSVILAMSLLVCFQEFVRTMGSGLEMHQLVKVKPIKVYYGVFKKIIEQFYPIYSSLS